MQHASSQAAVGSWRCIIFSSMPQFVLSNFATGQCPGPGAGLDTLDRDRGKRERTILSFWHLTCLVSRLG